METKYLVVIIISVIFLLVVAVFLYELNTESGSSVLSNGAALFDSIGSIFDSCSGLSQEACLANNACKTCAIEVGAGTVESCISKVRECPA